MYQHPANNFGTTLASAHVAADGELVLTSATGLGSLLSYEVYRVTALLNPNTANEVTLAIFEATGLTGATLTGVTAVEGYSDRGLDAGTTIQVRATAKTFSEMQAALHTLETTAPQSVDLSDPASNLNTSYPPSSSNRGLVLYCGHAGERDTRWQCVRLTDGTYQWEQF